jgi:hypothetical protein
MNLDGLATCERLHARIPAAFCAVYRKTHDVCRGCRQAEDMDALAAQQPQERPELKTGGAEKGKPATREDDMGNKPIRECKGCGEVRTIQGRGKCGSCYHKELRAEQAGRAEKHEQVKENVQAHQKEIPSGDAAVSVNVRSRQSPPFADVLDDELQEIREFLISKNQAYGNSAVEPVRVFSKADAVEQIRVRIDDKISRLMRGRADGEDTELDLLGYLILLRVATRMQAAQ